MNSCKIVTLIRVQTVSLWPWLPLHIGSWALQPQESLIVLLISGKKTFQTLCTFFFNHKLGINSFWKWIIPVRFQFGGNWCLDTTVGILKAIVDPCSFLWWTTNAWESTATHSPNTHTFFFFCFDVLERKDTINSYQYFQIKIRTRVFFPSHFSVISVALFYQTKSPDPQPPGLLFICSAWCHQQQSWFLKLEHDFSCFVREWLGDPTVLSLYSTRDVKLLCFKLLGITPLCEVMAPAPKNCSFVFFSFSFERFPFWGSQLCQRDSKV